MRRLITTVFPGVALAALFACSADPEPDSPGTCTLSCGGAKLGTSEMSIKPLFGLAATPVTCFANFAAAKSKTVPLNGPLMARFRVTTKVREPNGGAGTGSTDTGSGFTDLPRAGVAFEPVVTGVLDIPKTNAEHLNADGTVTPFKFGGIVTPSSEWCSDSCGIMTFEFWPDCVEGTVNPVTANVLAGGATPSDRVSFDVSNSSTADQ